MQNFAWKPLALAYVIALSAIGSAVAYAFAFPVRVEIVLRNLRAHSITAKIETSNGTYRNHRLEAGQLWRVPVTRREYENWFLRVDWKTSEGKNESRTQTYGEFDGVIQLDSNGLLTAPWY